jgi:outer membrane murein-binding lipoprotein Lpp
MTRPMRALITVLGGLLLSGCSAKPEWDNTQATMDPIEKYSAEMKAKQDAAPPIPATPKPVAAAPAPTAATPAPVKAQ